jgi:hypothetical protein
VRRCYAVARVAELHDALVATSDRLPQIWASRASDGLEQAPDGLGRARSLRFAVLSVGGGDGSARVGRRRGRRVAAGLLGFYGPI